MSDEEELVDPKIELEAKCQATVECAKLLVQYEACQARIEAKACGQPCFHGSGNCEGQYSDWVGCVDSCVAKSIFSKLK